MLARLFSGEALFLACELVAISLYPQYGLSSVDLQREEEKAFWQPLPLLRTPVLLGLTPYS